GIFARICVCESVVATIPTRITIVAFRTELLVSVFGSERVVAMQSPGKIEWRNLSESSSLLQTATKRLLIPRIDAESLSRRSNEWSGSSIAGRRSGLCIVAGASPGCDFSVSGSGDVHLHGAECSIHCRVARIVADGVLIPDLASHALA